ncbi:hypothetical protein RHSIM_Rhsim11G0132600 [Rhododendron simsii]|uniref:CSN8/PSMD8/EIF3K domain-containing protein n=1 Tax=Rhododendron simsii TaxID=118357 RepID=A0A834G6R3_RHOSS|nr:hypothetical protein RHSIM_Rhsim11G0132600 [Rhododendron simsii]
MGRVALQVESRYSNKHQAEEGTEPSRRRKLVEWFQWISLSSATPWPPNRTRKSPPSATNSCFRHAILLLHITNLSTFTRQNLISFLSLGCNARDCFPRRMALPDSSSRLPLRRRHSIPSSIKETSPELVAVWKIGQRLWMRDYAGVHEAIHGFNWSQEVRDLVAAFSDLYTKKMFELLLSAYSTISIQDTALFLGMNEDDATNYVLQHGWSVDPDSRMLTVKKQPVVKEQKIDPNKLQRLTEYVFHLEH